MANARQEENRQAPPPRKDPVCGMDVNPDAVEKTWFNGTTYAFCSRHCRQVFDKDPKKYESHHH